MTHSAFPGNFRSGAALAGIALIALLAGCAAPPADAPPKAAAAPAAPAAPPPAAPPPVAAAPAVPPILQQPIQPLDEAVLRAANNLFANAQLPPGPAGAKYSLTIDPLVDGLSGAQTVATRSMEQRITNLVRSVYPQYDVQPFTTSTVAKAPILLVGTFTTINDKAQTTGDRDAFRICLALADLRTGKIVAKGIARARIEGVDVTPLPYFGDSPVIAPDKITEGYVKTCQATRIGDPIDPTYWDSIIAAALINDAMNAYNEARYQDALDLYKGALLVKGGDQLRAYNGIYLANARLNRANDATQAFGKVVDYGIASKRLSVKFLFGSGSTVFISDPKVSAPYRMWVNQIAKGAAKSQSCVEIVGHTSRTGPEPLNERLSLVRAQYVKGRLDTDAPALKTKTKAVGKGSQENLIGIGTDDARDALDRRVEFKVVNC